MNISYLPPADAVDAAEPTGSGWIIRFLEPGDRLGHGALHPGYGGIEFFNGGILIGDLRALAALGHALVMRFDPPHLARRRPRRTAPAADRLGR